MAKKKYGFMPQGDHKMPDGEMMMEHKEDAKKPPKPARKKKAKK